MNDFTNPTPILTVKKKKFNSKKFLRLAKELQSENKIKRLPNHRGIKLSSTVSGQRELFREYKNKINEIIDYINNND